MKMRTWSNSDGSIGITLDKVQGFVLKEEELLYVFMGAGDEPYHIDDQDDIDSFIDAYYTTQRKFWISDKDTCTIDLSRITLIIFNDGAVKVYDGTDTAITMPLADGRSLRNAWIEYLAWS